MLSRFPLLESLKMSLSGKSVTDVLPLAQLKDLKEVRFSLEKAASSADEFAAWLGTIKSLARVELIQQSLTDAGLKHLESLKLIEVLTIKGAQVTDAGLASFKRARPKCNVVR